MRLCNFSIPDEYQRIRFGAYLDGKVIDIACAKSWAQGAKNIPGRELPETVMDYLRFDPWIGSYLQELFDSLNGEDLAHLKGANRAKVAYDTREVIVYSPVINPHTIRDFYAFEEHVKNVHKIRGKDIPEEWYQFPAFYYANTSMLYGQYATIPLPAQTQEMDYELEIGCVIGKVGINISVEDADAHIGGYTILNDWTARDIQRAEMKIGLGPTKSKDFATSLGPWLVTPDELLDRKTDRAGVYDLKMEARINGDRRSLGNWKDIHYSFAEMIAQASRDTYLTPGDVIGSGTVGTGCILEWSEGNGPWLKPGDIVELEVEHLGTLINRVGEHQAFVR